VRQAAAERQPGRAHPVREVNGVGGGKSTTHCAKSAGGLVPHGSPAPVDFVSDARLSSPTEASRREFGCSQRRWSALAFAAPDADECRNRGQFLAETISCDAPRRVEGQETHYGGRSVGGGHRLFSHRRETSSPISSSNSNGPSAYPTAHRQVNGGDRRYSRPSPGPRRRYGIRILTVERRTTGASRPGSASCQRAASVEGGASASSLMCAADTTSTSGIFGTGLKKCRPKTAPRIGNRAGDLHHPQRTACSSPALHPERKAFRAQRRHRAWSRRFSNRLRHQSASRSPFQSVRDGPVHRMARRQSLSSFHSADACRASCECAPSAREEDGGSRTVDQTRLPRRARISPCTMPEAHVPTPMTARVIQHSAERRELFGDGACSGAPAAGKEATLKGRLRRHRPPPALRSLRARRRGRSGVRGCSRFDDVEDLIAPRYVAEGLFHVCRSRFQRTSGSDEDAYEARSRAGFCGEASARETMRGAASKASEADHFVNQSALSAFRGGIVLHRQEKWQRPAQTDDCGIRRAPPHAGIQSSLTREDD